MAEQEKLEILAADFKRLDESHKDQILDLTRKLAYIHCAGDVWGKNIEYVTIQGENSRSNQV